MLLITFAVLIAHERSHWNVNLMVIHQRQCS